MSSTSTTPVWFRPKGAAVYTGLSKDRLARLRLSGLGPVFTKIGKTVQYEQTALDHWLLSRKRRSTSEAN